MELLVWLVALAIGLVGAVYLWKQQQGEALKKEQKRKQKQLEEEARAAAAQRKSKPKPKKVDVTAQLKKNKHATQALAIDESHPLLQLVLQDHKYGITAAAYSPSGRLLATSSTDRTIRIYRREQAQGKTPPRPLQITMEYDNATALSFSSDGRTLIAATTNGMIKLYRKLKVKPELAVEFSVDHKMDVHSVLMNDIGQWAVIVTCAGESDTDLKFWGTDGTLLQTVNTNQVTNYHCVGSKDNRYIAVAAYTSEVKIFEITREKNGSFKHADKVMALQGHRTGLVDLAFDGSSTLPVNHIVTCCKDGSSRVWDINVRYTLQEDPKVVKSFPGEESKAFQSVDVAPNGKILVGSRDRSLVFLSLESGKEFFVIEEAFEDTIKRVVFCPQGNEVIVFGKNAKHAKIYAVPNEQ